MALNPRSGGNMNNRLAKAKGFDPEQTHYTGSCYTVLLCSLDADGCDNEGWNIGPEFRSYSDCMKFYDSITRDDIRKSLGCFPKGDQELKMNIHENYYENGAWQGSEEVDDADIWPVQWRGGKPVVQWSRRY